jgi:hypothetical protein
MTRDVVDFINHEDFEFGNGWTNAVESDLDRAFGETTGCEAQLGPEYC